jgi:hypothetical protein
VLSRGRVLCPGPGHSRDDRSLCVWFDGDDFTTHSFANDDFKDCRRHVEAILGLEKEGYRYHVEQPAPVTLVIDYDEERTARAQHLWGCRIKDTSMVERYLAARGYTGPLPSSIGFLPPGTYAHPAMIAKFGLGDDVRGVHLTFLNGDGTDKADLPRGLQRRTLGKFIGSPIVLAEPTDMLGLCIAEGVETALSAHMATGLGAWAAGSATFLPYLADAVPGCVEAVTACADEDEAGRRGAEELARTLQLRGFEVFMEQGNKNNGSGS